MSILKYKNILCVVVLILFYATQSHASRRLLFGDCSDLLLSEPPIAPLAFKLDKNIRDYWIRQQPKELQAMLKILSDEVVVISHKEFVQDLKRSFQLFLQSIAHKNKEFIFISSEDFSGIKSGQWVFRILVQEFPDLVKPWMYMSAKEYESDLSGLFSELAETPQQKFHDKYEIIFIDDYIGNGTQVRDLYSANFKLALNKALNEYAVPSDITKIKFNVVVPYLHPSRSTSAINYFEKQDMPAFFWGSGRALLTVRDALAKNNYDLGFFNKNDLAHYITPDQTLFSMTHMTPDNGLAYAIYFAAVFSAKPIISDGVKFWISKDKEDPVLKNEPFRVPSEQRPYTD